jgi:raffinose/stachyose/melibiose transport system permease protein
MMRGRRFDALGPGIFVFAILWLGITLFPLYFTILSSFKDNTAIFSRPLVIPDLFLWSNYSRAIMDAKILRSVFNSLVLSVSSIGILLFLVSLTSYVLARVERKWTTIVYLLFLSGFLLPVQSSLIPLAGLVSSFRGFNNYLMLIALFVAYQSPLAVFLVTGYMKTISRELDEAAIMEGCGYMRYLVSVMIPLSAPILATTGIVSFLFVYNDLIFSMLFLSKKELFTVSLGLTAFVGARSSDFGPIFASIVISSMPMIVIYILLQEHVQKGVTAGAVKG